MYKMIRLNENASNKLESLKTKYNFTTYSNCIEEIANFFIKSGISPLDYDIDKNFITLTDFVKKKFDQLQARNTAVEKDYFIGFRKDMNNINSFILNTVPNVIEEKKVPIQETNHINKISKLENEINDLQKTITANKNLYTTLINDTGKLKQVCLLFVQRIKYKPNTNTVDEINFTNEEFLKMIKIINDFTNVY